MILAADGKIFGLIKPLIFPLRNNRTKLWFQITEHIYHIYYNENENQLDNFMIYREFVISLQNCKLKRFKYQIFLKIIMHLISLTNHF